MIKGKTEPRIYTKPARELTDQTSLGFAFIEWCQEVCEINLLPWQEWLAIHALEIEGNFEDGWRFRFRKVFVLIGRQNGKSLFAELLALFFMYVLESRLVLGTAQNLDTAEEVWDAAIDRAEESPEMAAMVERVGRVNGKKDFELTNGAHYKVVAATRKGARGKRSDMVLIDELREQTTWDGWGAVSKTTNARPNGILFGLSNAGDAQSVVLRHFRMIAHKELGDPDGIAAKTLEAMPEPESDGEPIDDDGTVALFEWSAAPGADVMSREAWAQANPSLGYGFMTERALKSDAIHDPEYIFRTECLCQWVEAVARSPFPEGAWERWQGESIEAEDAPLFFGIDMSADRTNTAIAFVAQREDGSWHGEVEAFRTGFDWARKLLARNAPLKIALQGRGAPIASHINELEAIDGLEITTCEGRDLAAWTGRFYDAITAGDENGAQPLHHIPQPALDFAAQTAQTKALGDGAFTWDRQNSTADISPLVALTMAYGLATVGKTETRIYETVYEERGVLTV